MFSSIISVGCIYTNEKDCTNLINIYQENFFGVNNSKFFNFTLFVMIQNEKLVEKMMEKKNIWLIYIKILEIKNIMNYLGKI
jgi:hypothetical protein